jgi:hypothetical protein
MDPHYIMQLNLRTCTFAKLKVTIVLSPYLCRELGAQGAHRFSKRTCGI